MFFNRLLKHPNFMHVGPNDANKKVTIMSFNIRYFLPDGKTRWLDSQFVVKLLNDIFGI
jgi:selenocysteine lyase/cysteine desulfurase